MTRYLSSFIITAILYSIVIGVFFYAYSNQKINTKKRVEKKRVSLKHIELVKKIEPKLPVVEKKIIKPLPKLTPSIEKVKTKKIVKKRVQKKKIVKKRVQKKKKIKKIAKKKPVKKIIPKKVVEKKLKKIEELKKEEPKVIQEMVKEEPIIPLEKVVKVSSSTYKKDFLKKNLLLIKKHIQNNVKYSKRARKMNIQGDVLVEFSLSKDGKITDIKALSGHRLLRKSTIKAIHKAAIFFPKVSRNITIKVPIEYKLI
ncbi:energy transducer TonB [Arcobacter sp. LA11]|uniref:energy transducer TonB n=1 Tax=Arcobacter sp. LA11 TaxID=1898176 RepID=UPI000933F686|nr:energy transducer TonB [Arcobacter sp. LA11]